ncbi:FAD/NAD(P)-binding domain-containing protein [Viridothelium virens]|uniref:FAD/NAD(P)-binding domain-containing protein n=1 Tax=Viridothelium virens TaxID=1048519 RepID=A0A6A6H261_VIRVR|nr:FAD/NAD(P)-binding domain-containing protein [Viridothelium virens]
MSLRPDQYPNILIIGAGIFGTSTAYHLSLSENAKKPSVTVIDTTPTPPSPGASNDLNKIIRADYTNELYMKLALEAIEQWAAWDFLKPFYHNSGRVTLNEWDSDYYERIQQNFVKVLGKDPTATFSLKNNEAKEKWKKMFAGTKLDGLKDAYWNSIGGWCDADLATKAMMKEAQKNGVNYVSSEVKRLILGSTGLRGAEVADGRVFTADKILLATGAWTSSLMSPVEDSLSIPFEDRVELQATAAGVCVLHYHLGLIEMRELQDMPVFIYGTNGEVLPPSQRSRILKYTNANSFSNHYRTSSGQIISAPPRRSQFIVSEKLKKETMEVIGEKAMPRFSRGKEPDHWRLCWDAVTPSQDHLITKHPDPRLSNLYFAVGGSFHSYKFLPNIGSYVCRVLEGLSNGNEKDQVWRWKTGTDGKIQRGAHEKIVPTRELKDLEEDNGLKGKL